MEAGGYKLNMEETDFSELVIQCAHEFSVRFPQRTITSQIQSEIYVMADLLLLQMAVNNLIDNALKYSPKDLPITIQLSEANGKCALAVLDEGKGIADEENQKCFKNFTELAMPPPRLQKELDLVCILQKK
jgi:K+-sensing histidine kinase KdpD